MEVGSDLDLEQSRQTLQYASYDATLRVPRCAVLGSDCDSSYLLEGRGTVGPELYAPNTVSGSCADGNSGAFHVSESLDGLKVATTNGTAFAPGKTVRVEARVYASSTNYRYDVLDLFYAANASDPTWVRIGTYSLYFAGSQTLTASYVLPSGASMQAIRGRFRLGGTAVPCGVGTTDDHDDLVFAVSGSDTTAPTVSLTSPAAGASLPTPVTLNASATDNVGVARVEFYDGATLLGADTTSPYSFSWANPSLGSHTVTAKAVDTASNLASSVPVTFTVAPDTTPPSTAITGLSDGARVATSITLFASAADDVGVTRVEFYVDSALIATDASSPYYVTWNPTGISPGTHVLTTRAYDSAGNVGVSAPVAVQYALDTVLPVITQVAPAEGSVLSGSAHLEANATDDVGMQSVSFLVNGSFLTGYLGNTTTQPWWGTWRTFEWDNGPYQLTATARDTSGNVSPPSAPINVVVANTGRRYARYDSVLKVPKCTGASALCDSGVLLEGRGTLSAGPERNSPNSLSISPSCMDGEEGNYRAQGSIEALRVTSLAGGVFMPGSQVRLDVPVWASSNYTLYLYTSNGVSPAVWTLMATFTTSGSGVQVFSTTYTLGASPVQAVRAVYRSYSTGASTCAGGSLNDNDDLVFEVGQADTTAPGVWMLTPAKGAQVEGSVNLSATAADVVGVNRVEFYDGATLVGLDAVAPYAVTWDASAAGSGAHTLTARAYDAAGNLGTSTAVNVTVP
ncbi:Ig-like domain-containing protein [Myxococcus eversor]|uniref:Ig-like domain-containing protein n=1 Tax=Myxococcus eversor TaxID=2709661 RepID=UPI0013D4C682|nr:Ig-like domain-containing protein [Myxococcus eversor]